MKDWLSIGQFSKQTGLTPKALRLYEKAGLIRSRTRGDNNYRYFGKDQLTLARRIKSFRSLGFSLSEIGSLLQADADMDFDRLGQLLSQRQDAIERSGLDLARQRNQIIDILSSLKQSTKGLEAHERRYIMSRFEEPVYIVTGVGALEDLTAQLRTLLKNGGLQGRVIQISEEQLQEESVRRLKPNVVIIRGLSAYSDEIENRYLALYSAAGPHMTTVFNADDRPSVSLAANEHIRKGRTFYFSKNTGLEPQIRKIGGSISDGETLQLFGFNLQPQVQAFRSQHVINHQDEVTWLAALTALLDAGMTEEVLFSTLKDSFTPTSPH